MRSGRGEACWYNKGFAGKSPPSLPPSLPPSVASYLPWASRCLVGIAAARGRSQTGCCWREGGREEGREGEDEPRRGGREGGRGGTYRRLALWTSKALSNRSFSFISFGPPRRQIYKYVDFHRYGMSIAALPPSLSPPLPPSFILPCSMHP